MVLFSGDLPKLSNGKCNESQNAEPSAKTAVSTFTATITLTLKLRPPQGLDPNGPGSLDLGA